MADNTPRHLPGPAPVLGVLTLEELQKVLDRTFSRKLRDKGVPERKIKALSRQSTEQRIALLRPYFKSTGLF